jgi:hypothetical protein
MIDLPDPHFGSDEEMLAWCRSEGITPVKDEDGEWDWFAAWDEYMSRPEKKEED